MINWAIKYTGKDFKNNTDVPPAALCAYSNHKVKHHIHMQISYPEALSLKNNSRYSSLEVHASRFLLTEYLI